MLLTCSQLSNNTIQSGKSGLIVRWPSCHQGSSRRRQSRDIVTTAVTHSQGWEQEFPKAPATDLTNISTSSRSRVSDYRMLSTLSSGLALICNTTNFTRVPFWTVFTPSSSEEGEGNHRGPHHTNNCFHMSRIISNQFQEVAARSAYTNPRNTNKCFSCSLLDRVHSSSREGGGRYHRGRDKSCTTSHQFPAVAADSGMHKHQKTRSARGRTSQPDQQENRHTSNQAPNSFVLSWRATMCSRSYLTMLKLPVEETKLSISATTL